MTSFAEARGERVSFAEALIGAVQTALRADAGVTTLVPTNRVFDVVPGVAGTPLASIRPPWIYVGPLSAPRFGNDCHRGWRPRIRLFAVTDAFNRDAAWRIVDAIDAALDRKTLDLADGFSMASQLEAVDCGDLIDPTKPRAAFADFECVIFREASFDAPDED